MRAVHLFNVAAMDRLQWVSQTPYRVVIAEDEALIRLDLKEMLEEPGQDAYVVVGEASDGDTAVKLAAELRPDLVIMDVKMPVLDGISAAEQITARRLAPVVILTAFSQRDLVQRASSAGAMAYLVKPFTRADLIPAIEIAVTRFAEVNALQAEVGDLRERLEMRKLLDRAKGVLQSSARDERARGVPVDPEDFDGPPHDHAGAGAGDPRRAPAGQQSRPNATRPPPHRPQETAPPAAEAARASPRQPPEPISPDSVVHRTVPLPKPPASG